MLCLCLSNVINIDFITVQISYYPVGFFQARTGTRVIYYYILESIYNITETHRILELDTTPT